MIGGPSRFFLNLRHMLEVLVASVSLEIRVYGLNFAYGPY